MKKDNFLYDESELEILENIDKAKSITVSSNDKKRYSDYAKYTKSLKQKKQTTIRFSVNDLAIIKAKAKKLGIGYQNLIQSLVHNYAQGKIKIEI